MNEPKALNGVALFHQTFGHPILDKPQIPVAERATLRLNLIKEELRELEEAIEKNDIIEAADAMADLQYVLAGAVLEFGLGEKFADLFAEVQRSNMTKACKDQAEAEATVEHYNEQGQPAEWKETAGLYLVYRKEDNKLLKSINYSPTDLPRIIENDDYDRSMY